MQKRIVTTLIAVLLIFLLSSCGKERKQGDDAPAAASPTAATTETLQQTSTPALTSTPTPSPTPSYPDRPNRLSTENVALAMEDMIDSFEYAYRQTVTHASKSPLRESRYFGEVAVLYTDPDGSRSLNIAEFSPLLSYNREILYYDADLKLRKTRLLLNDRDKLTVYATDYGLVIDCDGDRYYDISFEETDADGRLVYVADDVHSYTCYDYDEKGKLSGKYEYYDDRIKQYTLYTYDTEGRLLTETESQRLEENSELTESYRSARTYDEAGNITSLVQYDEYAAEKFGYYYTYRKDAIGRLSERTVKRVYSDGSSDTCTFGFKYYSNGPILVYGPKEYEEEGGFIVFLPDEETKTKLYTCSGITASDEYAFHGYDSDSHDTSELCYTSRLELADSGVEGYLQLPKAEIPADKSICLVHSLDSIKTYPRLTAADIYDDSLFPHEDLKDREMFASYSAGEQLLRTYLCDKREEETYVAAWDKNGRLTHAPLGFLTYDNDGRIIGWTDVFESSYYRGSLFYDDNGKLTFLESDYNVPETEYRQTSVLYEYHGDGND